MEISTARIVTILAILYGKKAELVVNHSQEKCYLFFNNFPQDLEIYYEEVEILESNQIIELDGGCDEEGHVTSVYRLSEFADQKIDEIIKNKKQLTLKEV
jgi:hypothetical protein